MFEDRLGAAADALRDWHASCDLPASSTARVLGGVLDVFAGAMLSGEWKRLSARMEGLA